MFGLGGRKRSDSPGEFVFELEREFKDRKAGDAIARQTAQKMERVRVAMRKGGEQSDVNRLSQLLQGYGALLKVLSRARSPKR